MESRRPHDFLPVVVDRDCLDKGCENSVGPRWLHVHVGWGDVSVVLPLFDQLHYFFKILAVSLSTVLQKSLAFLFSYLEFAAGAKVKQIVDRLIVNFNIWTFHLEVYLHNPLVFENGLVVNWRLIRGCAAWPLQMRLLNLRFCFYLSHLLKKVLEASWK